jgi:DNA-directed RNA polymerase I, II, and III subunit RPABC2
MKSVDLLSKEHKWQFIYKIDFISNLKIISIDTKMSDYEGSDNEDIFKSTTSDLDSDTELESDNENENENVKSNKNINSKITTKHIVTVDSDNSDVEQENETDDELPADDDDDDVDIDDDIDEDQDIDENGNFINGPNKKTSTEKNITMKTSSSLEKEYSDDSEDEDADEDEDENYQKFDSEINKNYIVDYHPECMIHNYDEISALTKIHRDKNNVIIDSLHHTVPFLTKYERARVLGQRAKQINSGARPFVRVPENIIDGYLIAELELQQKKIPFIIRRPLPGAGSEYWNLKDLELVSF